MTDVLLRPEDSGEIPTVPQFDPDNPGTHAWDCDCEREQNDPGPDTRNLSGYAAGLPPVRRPDAVQALIADHTTGEVATYPTPDPVPPPPPPTPARRGWWERLRYRGEHRAAGR